MAHEVLMPKLSSTMDVGEITMWFKEEGDPVAVGEAVFEVMTDKIAIEVEAYEEGILLKKYIEAGEKAPVNSVIAYIGEAGEKVPDKILIENDEKSSVKETDKQETDKEKDTVKVENVQSKNIRATPAARRIAREQGIELSTVTGSGPKGRIQAQDVKKHKVTSAVSQSKDPVTNPQELKAPAHIENVIPWSGMRKVIADRMSASKATIPHVTMNAEVDMTKVKELRGQLLPLVEEQSSERISFLEIIIKATMVALKAYPEFNAHAYAEGIHRFSEINLGLAVAVSEGLVVPVIHNADAMGLGALTKATKEIAAKARDGQLSPKEMSGGTFTISSLGKTKVQSFNPIINAPEVAILGVGGMYDKVIVEQTEEGPQFKATPVVNLSLSFDHRVVDGAPASAFLSMIAETLENPMKLLL